MFSFKLDYGINSILFQRGIYPAESFENHQKYGLTILMSTDAKIKDFLKNVLKQTEGNDLFIYEDAENKNHALKFIQHRFSIYLQNGYQRMSWTK